MNEDDKNQLGKRDASGNVDDADQGKKQRAAEETEDEEAIFETINLTSMEKNGHFS